DVREAALVGPPRGVAQRQGQDVDAEVVVVAPPDGAADEEASVAAADVDDDGGNPAEEGGPVQRSFARQFLEGSVRPLLRRQDIASDGDAKLALDAAVTHEHCRISQARVVASETTTFVKSC